jgi:hypothetical protein
LLLPFLTVGPIFKELPNKARIAAYFAALGLGFMFLEVTLIQKFTLFLGYPTYSLSVTLFGLLVFSGLGSLGSERFARRGPAFSYRLFALLAVLVVAYQLVFPSIVEHLIGTPLAVRVAITIALLAPVGLCLGAFLPIGLGVVAAQSEHSRVYVAWAWAINGFFSVIASILSTILAMAFGFKVLLLLALLIYLVGVVSLSTIPIAGRTAGEGT